MTGILYIVASPIGCLQDISARAIAVLRSVSLIACEDTRHSRILLQHYGIVTPMTAYHSHNEDTAIQSLLDPLQNGKSIALLSDAGTPLVHDPGLLLVQRARSLDIPVVPIPGPCAIITALSAAGLPAAQFIFEGFLPNKSSARKKVLEKIQSESRTVVFYEAPHRIKESLEDMIEILGGEREAVLARELTKMHETFLSGTLSALLDRLITDPNQQKGEFVVLIAGKAESPQTDEGSFDQVLTVLLAELPLKQAVDLTAKLTGISKNKVYTRALLIKP
jgi:16S rRNA (cytidine1402-2'-O)-methyltransferase